MNPTISVIMPVYNAELYIREAIESILNQTFTNFELLIFNDASTDSSDEIIRSFKDRRIVYEIVDRHAGYVVLLNKGLGRAKGKYIARMDADDISMPNRFEEQVSFLEERPEVGICGTWYNFFGGTTGLEKTPWLHEEVQLSLFYGTPFGHPTVIMRKEFLDKYNLSYNNDFLYAEDYELFERASIYCSLVNIPKPLLQYRKHSTQVTSTKWQLQYFLAGKIQARRFLRALDNVKQDDTIWFENFFTGKSITNESWFSELELYKNRIITENRIYPQSILFKATESLFESQKIKNVYNYFFSKYYLQKKYNLSLLQSFVKEKYKPYKFLNKKHTVFFIIKCLIGYKKRN